MSKERTRKIILLIALIAAASLSVSSLASCSARSGSSDPTALTDPTGAGFIVVTPVNTHGSDSTAEPQETPQNPSLTGEPSATDGYGQQPSTEGVKKLDLDPEFLYSRNVILKDIDTGAVLYSLSPDEKIYPASLTKIMTGLLAAELLPGDKDYTITQEVMDLADSLGASTSGFSRGETTDKNGIIAGILMASGADCSFTAAIEIAGSEQAFVELMNKKAQELGLSNTHFVTCTGLHDDGHYTTVSDLEKLTEHAIRNELFAYFFGLETYAAKVLPEHQYTFNIVSTVFSGLGSFDLGKVEVMGGKTGYTRQAGLCLVTYSTYKGHRYVLVTAGNDGNTKTEKYHFIDAQTIYGALQKEV